MKNCEKMSVCRFSIHFDGNFAIFPVDEGAQEHDWATAFSFDGKGDLRVDGIQSVLEG